MSSIIVIGTASRETYTDEHQRSHTRLGGVAATIAHELHRGGHDVALHTILAADTDGAAVQRLLDHDGIPWTCVYASHHPTAYANWQTAAGRVTRSEGYHLPTFSQQDIPPAYLRTAIASANWVVADTNLDSAVLATIATQAVNAVFCVTAPSRVNNLPQLHQDCAIASVAMNLGEARRLLQPGQVSFTNLRARTNAATILVTNGYKGWTAQHNGVQTTSPAPEPPAGCDYIGAGDSACAGLVHALTTGDPLDDSINGYISRRLAYTAALN